MRSRCLVCRQEVSYSKLRHNIATHLDSRGLEVCPMSGHPYEFTVTSNR